MTNFDGIVHDIRESFFSDEKFSCEDISVHSDRFSDYEGNAVAEFFSGKSNSDISLSRLEAEYAGDNTVCLFFMRPSAAAYFVGGYMHVSLVEGEYGGALRQSLMNLFDFSLHRGGAKSEKWFYDFVSALSSKQKNTVLKYIFYVRDNYKDDLLGTDFERAISIFSAS